MIPLLCCLALGQGVVLAPKAVWSPKTTIFPGASAGGATAALNGSPSTAQAGGASTTLSVTLNQSIPAGHFLVIAAVTDTAATTLSSISVGGTLVPCTACVFNSGHALTNTNGGWVLSTSSTAGPVVLTFSQSSTDRIAAIYDYSCTGGTVSHDADNTADNATDTSPIAGPTITLAGTNDVIVNWADGAGVDPTAVAGPFANFASQSGIGFANNLNTTSGTGAAFTAAGNSGGKTAAGIAMKCQ
jgi:hypothetical protein